MVIILKWVLQIGCEGMEWIQEVRDRVQWGGGAFEHGNEISDSMKG
jgi:hypothetical protein